jgi:hypothetical protein
MKSEFTEEFEEFWYNWPTRYIKSSSMYVKLGKGKAWNIWSKMSVANRKLAIVATGCMPKSAEWIPDAFRWLRDKGWLDYSHKQPRMAQERRTPSGPTHINPQVNIISIEDRQKMAKEMGWKK